MSGDSSGADVPTTLAGRVRSALESGDLDAIAELLDPAARRGAPEGPSDADCRNREEVIAWWTRARARSHDYKEAAQVLLGHARGDRTLLRRR